MNIHNQFKNHKLYRFLSLWLIFSLVASVTSADQLTGDSSAGEWRHPANCTGYACDYRAEWTFFSATDEIRFKISTKFRNKWTGIGFSDQRQMKGTDAVLGLVEESGRYFLMDTFLSGYQAPPLDAKQNIHNMSVWRENGLTHLQFHRYRQTDDPKFDFQFSDRHCAYFFFPVRGGVFNAVNKRMRKHEQVPIVSDRKICIRSADYEEPAELSTPVPSPRTTTKPKIPSRFQSRLRHSTTSPAPITIAPTPESNLTTSSSLVTKETIVSTPAIPITTNTSSIKQNNTLSNHETLSSSTTVTPPEVSFSEIPVTPLPNLILNSVSPKNSEQPESHDKVESLPFPDSPKAVVPVISDNGMSSIELSSPSSSPNQPENVLEEIDEEEETVEEEEKLPVNTQNPVSSGQPAIDPLSGFHQPGLIPLAGEPEVEEPDQTKHTVLSLDWRVANLHIQLNESQLRIALLSIGVVLFVLLLLIQSCCGCGCGCGHADPSQSPDAIAKARVHDLSNSSTLQDKQKLSLSVGHLHHAVGGFAGQPFSAYHEYQMGSTHSYEKLSAPPEPPRKGSRSRGWPKEAKYASVDPLYQSMARSSKDSGRPYSGSPAHHQNGFHQSPARAYSGSYAPSNASQYGRFLEPPGASGSLSSLQPDFYFMPHQRRYSGEIVRVFVDYDNPI